MTLAFPKVIRIEPASQCNLKCTHCPTGTVSMSRGIMSESTFSLVLSEIMKHSKDIKIIVLYHGGEPLLNKNFFKYIDSLKKININFFIKTVSNGTALNDENINKIAESTLDLIEFSLDGISLEDNELIRINSKTLNIISNIKKLISIKKSSLKVTICTTQFIDRKRTNFNESPQVPDWLFETFKDTVTYKPGYAILWPALEKSGLYDYINADGRDSNECDHIISTITIRSDGSIVPCCYDLTSQLVLGNIHKNSLSEIWENKAYGELRDSIHSKNYNSTCNKCATVRPPTYLIPKWR
jgi:radical SAM protein with 4Fe4S-binding SPASM domain